MKVFGGYGQATWSSGAYPGGNGLPPPVPTARGHRAARGTRARRAMTATGHRAPQGARATRAELRGYGEMVERPRGVPEDWVIRTATLEGRSPDYEALSARVDAMNERLIAQGYYPHGWSIPEDPATGTYGPAEVTYWGPVEEGGDTWRTVGLVLGVAAAGLSVIGMGISVMESQY